MTTKHLYLLSIGIGVALGALIIWFLLVDDARLARDLLGFFA